MTLIDVAVSSPRPRAAVIELKGEHDLTTRDELDDLVCSLVRVNDVVVVDITTAQFIDTSVLTTLLRGDRLARRHGKKLRLQTGITPVVRKALESSGVLQLVETARTRDEALAVTELRAPELA
jgi:anti-anti-sigma factor